MERALDFLLDSAPRNELRSPSGPTGNGLTPALRVNTLPTPSAPGWRTLRVPHTTRWRLEQQHEMGCTLSPAASQRLASLLRINYPLLVVQEIGARVRISRRWKTPYGRSRARAIACEKSAGPASCQPRKWPT